MTYVCFGINHLLNMIEMRHFNVGTYKKLSLMVQ